MQVNPILLCSVLLPLAVSAAPTDHPASPAEAVASLRRPAADITVTGTVLDEKKAGLPGATVVLKGTQLGTSTDADGKFTLRIPDGTAAPTLVISTVGYLRQEVPVDGRTSFTINLTPNAQDLSEVVVVGYGTQKRSDVTGSVVSVAQDRLEKIPVSNVAQALAGAVAGVNITTTSSVPGAQPRIQVRGVRSITASTDPYIIVDGLPFPGNLNDQVAASQIDLNFILDERVRELIGEEQRRLTLMRTGTLVERATRLNGVSITGLTKTHELLPIPQTTIDLNTNATLTQNPGY